MDTKETNEFIAEMRSMIEELLAKGPEACKGFLIKAGIVKSIEDFGLNEVSITSTGDIGLGIDHIVYAMEEGAESWKAEYDNCRAILQALVELKDHKDLYGKTEHYQITQPKTWEAAKKFLSKYQHQ